MTAAVEGISSFWVVKVRLRGTNDDEALCIDRFKAGASKTQLAGPANKSRKFRSMMCCSYRVSRKLVQSMAIKLKI